jgi:hypothetical protein
VACSGTVLALYWLLQVSWFGNLGAGGLFHLLVRYRMLNNKFHDRAMYQAVNLRPPFFETRVRARVNSSGICGGQIGPETGFLFPSSSVFPCQYHSTVAPYLYNLRYEQQARWWPQFRDIVSQH